MTIPQVVDGVTDADAAFMNQLVDAANQANAAFNGAGQITTAAITPALDGRVIAADAANPIDRQVLRPDVSTLNPRWVNEPMYHAIDFYGHHANPLQAMIDRSRGTWSIERCSGALLDLGEREHVITETLDFTRWSGILSGVGCGPSPSYSAHPGHGSVIRWDGAADQPMIRVRDSRDVILENFRLEGKDGVLPSSGIELYREASDQRGTNQFITMRDIHIGRYPWTAQGTNKGIVKTGIAVIGEDGNNDQFRIERVQVFYPTEYGLYVQNFNSYGGAVRSLMVQGAGIAAVSTGASIHLMDPEFFECATDIIATTNHTFVRVTNLISEDSGRLAQLPPTCVFVLDGGSYQMDTVAAGGKVLIAATPSAQQTIVLREMMFTPYPSSGLTGADAKIEIGGVSGDSANVGNFEVIIEACRGLEKDHVVFGSGASMWATTSRGTIQHQSRKIGNSYQWRNELRHSSHALIGSGARTTIDRSVWDLPITD